MVNLGHMGQFWKNGQKWVNFDSPIWGLSPQKYFKIGQMNLKLVRYVILTRL